MVLATWIPLALALICAWAAWRCRGWRPPAVFLGLLALLLLGAGTAGVPVVFTNSQLGYLPSYQATSVLRLGVATPGDALPQWFVPSGTACTISGGDVGSQVPAGDGGCFNAILNGAVDLKEFGIGAGGDISTALANAVRWAQNSGGGVIRLGAGQYKLLHGVSITGNNVAIVGPDRAPANFGFGWAWSAPVITWAPPLVEISCQDPTNPCVSFSGNALSLIGLEFSNPQPAPPASGAWTPTVWPYVFSATGGSWNSLHLAQLTFTAADYCINLQGAGNYNAGPQAFNVILRDIYFNGCWNTGLHIQQVDQTIKLDGLNYAYWWGLNNAAVTTYVEANKIDMDLCYVANPQISNVEFFQSYLSMRFTNCTVASGFGNVTFGIGNGQLTNISFNEVCQGMAVASGTTGVSFQMSNVLAYGDTTTSCPKTSPVFFNLASDNANIGMQGVTAGYVQSLISLGNGAGGTAVLQNVSIGQYSAFAAGAAAIRLSANAELVLTATPINALRPGTGAGGVLGPGVSGQGTLYRQQIGSCTAAIEGCVTITTGTGTAGGSVSVLEAGGTRDGYLQAFGGAFNLSTDSGPLNLNPGGSGALQIQGTPGVNCTGALSSSATVKLGIVTHC